MATTDERYKWLLENLSGVVLKKNDDGIVQKLILNTSYDKLDIDSFDDAIGNAMKPPVPKFAHGDHVDIRFMEHAWMEAIYNEEIDGGHWVMIKGSVNCVEIPSWNIRPAPYRIRMKPDEEVDLSRRLTLVKRPDTGASVYTLAAYGNSAQLEVIIE